MKRSVLYGILSIFLLFSSTGCSVIMAMNGDPEPDFDMIKVGTARQEVEGQLGKPIHSELTGEGLKKDSYEFERGDPPNGHRALMNLYIDFATIGLWEFPGTIIEAMMGEDQTTVVTYSTEDRIQQIEGYTPPQKSQEHQEALKAQELYSEEKILQD